MVAVDLFQEKDLDESGGARDWAEGKGPYISERQRLAWEKESLKTCSLVYRNRNSGQYKRGKGVGVS